MNFAWTYSMSYINCMRHTFRTQYATYNR
nr:unnamed protein product [Callosobruchus analis]